MPEALRRAQGLKCSISCKGPTAPLLRAPAAQRKQRIDSPVVIQREWWGGREKPWGRAQVRESVVVWVWVSLSSSSQFGGGLEPSFPVAPCRLEPLVCSHFTLWLLPGHLPGAGGPYGFLGVVPGSIPASAHVLVLSPHVRVVGPSTPTSKADSAGEAHRVSQPGRWLPEFRLLRADDRSGPGQARVSQTLCCGAATSTSQNRHLPAGAPQLCHSLLQAPFRWTMTLCVRICGSGCVNLWPWQCHSPLWAQVPEPDCQGL